MTLFNEVKLGVRGQTPMFGELKSTGHQSGAGFLLFRKGVENDPVSNDESITPVTIIPEEIIPKVEIPLKSAKTAEEYLADLNMIMKSDLSTSYLITTNVSKLIDIKKEIENNGAMSMVLDTKIQDIKKLFSLHRNLIAINEKREIAKKRFKVSMTSGGILLGAGIISGVISGSLFGTMAYYNDKFIEADQYYHNVYTSQAQSEALQYAQDVNNLTVSASVMAVITGLFITGGSIVFGLAPYDIQYKKQYDEIQSNIEKFNMSFTAGKDKMAFSFQIHF